MSEEGQDDSSKTEEPSHKRLEDSRKKGKIAATRELNHFFMMLVLTFFIFVLGPKLAQQLVPILSPFITRPDSFEMSSAGVLDLMKQVLADTGIAMLLMLMFSFMAALAPAIMQGKWVFASSNIAIKAEKISPLAGFKRIFGFKALIEFAKNLLKIVLIGFASVMVIMPYIWHLPGLMAEDKTEMLIYTQAMAGRMMIAACVFLFLLSIVDYLYQRFSLLKSLRMSKQEIKDEYKQQEGDPLVKNRLRQVRRDRARKRMMANVPNADVIVTNPTHYAIALKYDATNMPAPKVLAKGADDVAMRIREMATKHKIPIVRNAPLARVLYDTTEVDDEIPVEHYQAVAKIIGYIYRLKGKMPAKPATAAGKNAAKKDARPTLKLKK